MAIHLFAGLGDIDSVCAELRKGISVDARNENGLTPLACAAQSSQADVSMVRLLVEAGADIHALFDRERYQALTLAACSGSLEKVQFLADAGSNLRFKTESGYTVLVHVAYKLSSDERLVPMIQLLASLGADLDSATQYEESPLSVCSLYGRFDAVGALLDLGADPSPLSWSVLMKFVVFGQVCELKQQLAKGDYDLHKRDRWERTAWLLACVAGDIEKAKLLLEAGADLRDRERMGPDAIGICASRGQLEMVEWLLAVGADVDSVDDMQNTALMLAVQSGQAECVRALLEAGADPGRKNEYGDTTISLASTEEVMRLLIDAGESIAEINTDLKRRLLGLNGAKPINVTKSQYLAGCHPRYGQANPEVMDIPFWKEMVRVGISAYEAKAQFGDDANITEATWCYSRFGVSFTELPDGRFVQVGGEHEDYYDPDFCIHNDVLIHERGGQFTILGYPKEVFPPTDFHSATYFDGAIYIVGGLGYPETRQFGITPVFRLDCQSWRIEPFHSSGANPGWIYGHHARMNKAGELVISGGKICLEINGEEDHVDNNIDFTLNLENGVWLRA